jgi:predicted transport protein
MEKGLLEKTGKSLADWVKIVKAEKLEKHGEMVNFLKTTHGLGHGYANYVVHMAKESSAVSTDDDTLISDQYKGKEQLKPIFDSLLDAILKMGDDVEVAPKKASVSFRRKRQFCLVQPSTKSRIDVGLKFNDRPTKGRLESSGPFGAMCTHRVQITAIDQVDGELIQLIKDAYEEAG